MTKSLPMEHYAEVVTIGDVRLTGAQSFLARMKGVERFRGRYYVTATAGTPASPGVRAGADDWARILASCGRLYPWGGAGFSPTSRTKMAVVGSTTTWH